MGLKRIKELVVNDNFIVSNPRMRMFQRNVITGEIKGMLEQNNRDEDKWIDAYRKRRR